MVNLLKSITAYILLLAFLLIIANCGGDKIAEELTKDTTPPDTSITSQPLNLTNSTSANFSFTSTETGSTFECQIDNSGYTACTSPVNYTGLEERSHTFEVKAIDTANNTDQTPASYTWIIDTTAVEIFITSQPSNPTNSASATPTAATFIFTSKETATFQCQIDNGGYIACTSPVNYTGLAEGSHTFEIKATDAAGNTNSTSASYTWTIDTTPPNTDITFSPSNLTNSTSANFSFTSTETGSTFECQIDNSGYTACTSPVNYTGLEERSHTFEVKAIDTANNTDQTPASYTWIIDTTAATVSSTSPANGAAVNTTITATFSEGMDSTTTFTVSTGGSNISGTLNYDVSSNTATFTPSEPLSYNATYTVTIKDAKDLAGNTTTYTWNLVTKAAKLTWEAPTTNADGTALDNLSGYKVYYGTSPGNYSNLIDVGNVTTYEIDSLSPATYYFAVTAYDTSGNESDYSNEVSRIIQ